MQDAAEHRGRRGRRAGAAACALAAVSAFVFAGPAGAATQTVNFDDLAPNTRVSTEYQTSHGVTFPADPGLRPVVKTFPGNAHSGDRVGVYTCETLPGCGEGFSAPQLRGALTTSATSVSAYVGYWVDPAFPGAGDSFQVRIRAYDSDDMLVDESPYVTVTQGAPLNQLVSASAPAGGRIDYFDVIADAGDGSAGKFLAIDDLAITTSDLAPPPADFTLNQGQTVADVLTGTSVDIPVDMNRINGSNGDVSFSVTGLPTGMTAAFDPNPVTGTNTGTTMRLSAAESAAHSDQYTEITVTATPLSPGAGSRSRTITKQVRIRENCDRTLRLDYLDARSDSCMVRRDGVYEATNAEVRINGLIVRPADDSRPTLVIDPQNQTIKGRELTMPFRVSVAGSPEVPIYAGPISWSFAGTGDGPRRIFGADVSGVSRLKGIPITAFEASFLRSGKATVKPTLRLGFWPFDHFGSITTTTTFTTDNDGGADFSGLELKLAKVSALAIELKDVSLKWQQGGTWAGRATVILRFAKTYEVGAGFGIKDGSFDFLSGSIGGLNQPIGAGIFLQSLGFEVKRSPLTLAGSIGLSGGPSVAGVRAIGVGGRLQAVLDDPFIVEISGSAKVADRFNLANAFVRYSSTGLFEFGASAEWSLWRLSLDGGVDGWVDGFQAFNVEGRLSACLDVWGPNPCGSAKGILSTRGVAGCVGVYGYYVGAGATWNFDFDAFTGCDLAPYREIKPARVRTASELTRTRLPKGLPSAAWEVTADGGPTGVTLTGPDGQTVTVSRDAPVVQQGGFYAQLREDGTTFVLVDKPAGGTWTLSDDGTAPVTLVREARGLPQPRARARVRGRGRSRVLSWNVRRIRGQRVTFAEFGKDVRNAIVTTKARRGSKRFRVADGRAGRRRIVALVEQGGSPRTSFRAGAYRAPGMPKPGKPRKIRIKRSGSRLVVSWRATPRGFRHALYFRLSDGRRVVRVVAARRRSVRLKRVPRSVGARVRLLGLTPANGKGPSGRASIGPRATRSR